MEHWCKDCKHSNGDGNTCLYTGAVHTTGIECLAFEPKRENKMNEHEPVDAEWVQDGAPIRTFEAGSTRDTAQGKLDYVGALSPIVLRRFAQYMHENDLMPDGTIRSVSDWKRGQPQEVYHKSKARHFMASWLIEEGYTVTDNHGPVDEEHALCGELFNVMGKLHEVVAARLAKEAEGEE
jgi:hypothetical protein